MNETTQASAPPEKSGAMAELVEIIKTIVYALLIALFLRVLFFQPYVRGLDGAQPLRGRLHHRVQVDLPAIRSSRSPSPRRCSRPDHGR